jgi:outer membrane protein TolC
MRSSPSSCDAPLRGNLDVRTAISRVREARATMRSTRTQLLPSADASGSARATRHSSEAGSVAPRICTALVSTRAGSSTCLAVSAVTVDAAQATSEAREADLQDVLVTLTADVALNYVDIRSLQRRIEIAQSNINLQQRRSSSRSFARRRGLRQDLDVQQALSNVESTRAQIASLESQVAQSIHAIAILLGQPPAELNAEFTAAGPIPEAPIEATLGLPADALRRRPDVRSAERQLAAQAAQVNVARADLYPSFRLAGSIGLESLSIRPTARAGSGLLERESLGEHTAVQPAAAPARTCSFRASVRSSQHATMKRWSCVHCRKSRTA